MGCRRQKWLWAGGYRESERRNIRYGKAAPKVASGGYKPANSKFGEAKKRILLQEEKDVMKEQVGVLTSGKAVSLWG